MILLATSPPQGFSCLFEKLVHEPIRTYMSKVAHASTAVR